MLSLRVCSPPVVTDMTLMLSSFAHLAAGRVCLLGGVVTPITIQHGSANPFLASCKCGIRGQTLTSTFRGHTYGEANMMDLERLGAFYLGKIHDLESGETREDEPVMYDARDLTTHAVCVGMTGSGKTGLCIDLLEEAALDNVPAIIIDPKGDVTNLLLTFPELRGEDFLPWVNVDDARRKDLTLEEHAQKTADLWRNGLASWDEGPDRIRMLKDSADFVIYTPGSSAGVPVSILSSLAAPDLDWDEHEELLREKIQGTVSALLGLAGVDADPVRSREHILLSTIFEHAWREGTDLDLASVIRSVQSPPVRQLGVFDVDTFFPEKDRFDLAMTLNNLIAAPGFERWLEGQALDIPSILNAPSGKPRMAIFSIAHLSDPERMFFVTLLLEQILTWMRSQTGTTSLRALLYFDEVFGYFPPVAEPSSKRPLLTLLKQARAFGLGVMLTTQNPADLDYKGLTNAGTWFIGKLQTERDKARVLEGLETVVSAAGTHLDRKLLGKLISSLDSRVFLLHNVHEDGPVVFHTRWAMSYLRGPLTRQQIGTLMKDTTADAGGTLAVTDARGAGSAASTPTSAPSAASHVAKRAAREDGFIDAPPSIDPKVEQVFLPASLSQDSATRWLGERDGGTVVADDAHLVYEPMVLGLATIHFISRKYDLAEEAMAALLIDAPESGARPAWDEAEEIAVTFRDLLDRPAAGSFFPPEIPAGVASSTKFKALKKPLSDHLYRNRSIALMVNDAADLSSRPGETLSDFTVRCREAAREERDEALDKLSDRYEKKIDKLRDKIDAKQRDLIEDEGEYQSRKREEMISAGESVLGVFLGRRSSRAVSTAARKRRMTVKAGTDIADTKAKIADLTEDLADLQREARKEVEKIRRRWEEELEKVEEVSVTPRRTDVTIDTLALAWAPFWRITYPSADGRVKTSVVPAYPESDVDR